MYGSDQAERHAAWFHELDAWTEYWDIYHPETRGRFYFGDGRGERGLLTLFLPREHHPPAFVAWKQVALGASAPESFIGAVAVSDVAAAVIEVDDLVARLFAKYFGDARDPAVREDYLAAILGCATDSLPAAGERANRIPADDWRKPTAGRHVIDNDLMWFAWALHLEASELVAGADGSARRTLQLAGVVAGCSIDFAWRGHRRTRPEYSRDERTLALVRARSQTWSADFQSAVAEMKMLFRIREWGHL